MFNIFAWIRRRKEEKRAAKARANAENVLACNGYCLKHHVLKTGWTNHLDQCGVLVSSRANYRGCPQCHAEFEAKWSKVTARCEAETAVLVAEAKQVLGWVEQPNRGANNRSQLEGQ